MTFHGQFHGTVGVVPVEVNANVSVAFPVGFHWVVVTDDFLKMESISFVDILDSKVINNKGEGDGPCFVKEETSSVSGWQVS